ncbi:SusC/RagA family TonB-linked outer membrane protein [Paraflavitalea sp. CAU 1676]|uniref:SusC/RagA family TonB-linked outer membrane protein n=1 Tax=Paraflavitalea sp. CAU 1676 TaxID=3032598 RepID=UPI0023DC8FE2|nr:SusC/RagA family TonB-linked outer membrane protein [Paraflavitalea sp. CAU 1676]MDF2186918.1 SusC/RagA family TonB-linked outer membrane protein [Paraflavitalea sp. CAU 1676]
MSARRLFTAFAMLLLALCLHTAASAQEKIITGKISDAKDGAPIVGASVVPKGSTKGTSTGADGSFRINVAESVTQLTISSVGYTNQDVDISGKTVVSISMEPSNLNLNEVIVVGYGTARRKDVTGSVQSVKAKDFNKGVIISPDQAIQGKAAGVMVIANSGQPGGASTVRIRGTASIRSGQQPLYVVDGVPLSGTSARPSPPGNGFGTPPGTNALNFLNPNDIGSIEILKDASASAIYGSRGANGVILITTKRAQPGNPVIDVNATVGVSSMMKQLKVLDGNEYRSTLQKYGLTGGNFGGDYNAMDEITRTGFTQNYNVAMGGGTDNSRYRLSMSYLNQEGIIKESDFKKYTAYLNSSFKLLNNKKLNVDFSLLVSGTRESLVPISTDAGFTGSLIGQALQWNPTHALVKPGTDSAWIDPAVGETTVNPLAMLNAYDALTNENVILASVAPSYKITPNLEYKFQYSLTRRVGKSLGEIKRWINIEGIKDKGAAAISNAEEISQQVTNTLNYTKDISQSFSLNALVGYEYLKYESRSDAQFGTDFTDAGNLRYYDIMQYSTQGNRQIDSYSSPTAELQSFFARAILNYKDKLLFTGTIRADGSTKFGENNKYGYFPSLALAWNVTNEEFAKNSNWLKSLKLRLGWGKTGNQEFPSGASLRRYSFGQQSVNQENFENEDLKWETSTTSNAGIDFSIFDDRLYGAIDVFYKKTTDVLFEQNVAQPGPAGIKYWVNLPGNIVNKGLELSLFGALVRQKDLNWNVGINASFLRNRVEGIVGFYETGALHGQGISGATAQRLVSDQPLNVFYLAKYEGLDKATGQGLYTGGDPSINKFYVESPNPKTLLGLSTDVTYKRLSAVINMNGTFGHKVYNNTANTVLPIGNLGTRNIAKSLLGGDIQEALSNPITPSTRYLENGNYIKLANATLSYNFGKLGPMVRGLTVSLTGQNLFVITDFTGFDPEVNTDKSVGGIPSLGIEYTPYPTARTILLGVTLSL